VKTFEYIYAAADVSADGVIEQLVARMKTPESATVVSDDRMVRESIRASGGLAMRPEELFAWARACDTRLRQDAERRSRALSKDFRNGLDIDL
jgi:predicted RNA-binding protein with PIN domain